jgi:hypothetical protein
MASLSTILRNRQVPTFEDRTTEEEFASSQSNLVIRIFPANMNAINPTKRAD